MTEQELTYHDLVKQVKQMSERACWCANTNEITKDIPNLDNLVCLNTQFYIITQFPIFSIAYISPGIEQLLGISPDNFSMKNFFGRIHPDDSPVVLMATKKMTEIIDSHYEEIIPYESVVTLDYRIKANDGRYLRFLNQNCVICKELCCMKFLSLSIFTDISNIKTSRKIEFDFKLRGKDLGIVFPDEEMKNSASCFTHREREILSLLALGKNSSEIGEMLNISRHTVDTHRRNMLAKCNLVNTAELVAFSIENSLIPT
jgi:DNA-binding CsgD family transcriptional regulator